MCPPPEAGKTLHPAFNQRESSVRLVMRARLNNFFSIALWTRLLKAFDDIFRRIKRSLLHGLFPVVRAEVLRLLFTGHGEELYTRELAGRSLLALRTVQDELAKLDAADLIVSRSNGYQRFYRANWKHPLHAALAEVVRKGVAHAKPDARLVQRVRCKPQKISRLVKAAVVSFPFGEQL